MAYLFQDARKKRKLGAKTPWSVGWTDPHGRRRTRKIGSRSMAEKFKRKTEGQLASGTYNSPGRVLWSKFQQDYDDLELSQLRPRTRLDALVAFRHFERIIRPVRLSSITTADIDRYRSKRLSEPGRRQGDTTSPYTVKKELGYLRSALNTARRWKHIGEVPEFRSMKVPERIGPVITEAHFEAIYLACQSADLPKGLSSSPADWWRALLVFAITTGWRIDEILTFPSSCVDLDAGTIRINAADTKSMRDDVDYLKPSATEHLRKIHGRADRVFPWPHHRRTLDSQFHRIQAIAGIHLPCHSRHQHTDACHKYGFHALRRACLTENAVRLSAPMLKRKARHKSLSTTMRYISLAGKLKRGTENAYEPGFLRRET
jgi:integrase